MKETKVILVLCAGWIMFSCTNNVNSTETEITDYEQKSQAIPEENHSNIEANDSLRRETTDGTSENTSDSLQWVSFTSPSGHVSIFPLDDLADVLTIIFPTWGSVEEEFLMDGKEMEKPDSYESMRFRAVPTRFHDAFGINVEEEGYKRYKQFQYEKGQHITEKISSYIEQGKQAGYPRYTYAGIRERACIYADVPLFGREAGEPLNDKFAVTSYSQLTWIRVSYPEFNILANGYEEELPTDFDEVYKVGTAIFSYINDGFVFSFQEYPEEIYDEITFTIEIPIEGEYFQIMFNGEDYPESYYTYEHRVLRNENRVLKGSVTVKFE